MENLFRSNWLSKTNMLINYFLKNGFSMTMQDFKNYMEGINYLKLDHQNSQYLAYTDGINKHSESKDPAWKSKSIYVSYHDEPTGYNNIFLFFKTKYDIERYYQSLIIDIDEKFTDKIENINGKHRVLLPSGNPVFVENKSRQNDYHIEWPLGDKYITIDFTLLDENDPPSTRDYSTLLKISLNHNDNIFTIEKHFNEIRKLLKNRIEIGLTDKDNKMIDKYIITAIQYNTETEPVINQMKRLMNNNFEYYEMLYKGEV